MDLKLDGKIALVTGSSQGIGFGIASTLASEGCRVVLNGRNAEKLKNATSRIDGALGIQGDVSDVATCTEIIEKIEREFGRLDILLCNVGNGSLKDKKAGSPDDWSNMLNSNLTPTTNVIWAALHSLRKSNGTIICITSICGIEAIGCPTAYAASKAAIESFVRNSARELGKNNIRINSIAPGNILFSGSVWERKTKENSSLVESMLAKEVPLGRLGTPEDIGTVAAFLASPVSSFITGTTIIVDGGQTRS